MKNNPYIGPRPFERQHRDRFFGRDKEGRELQALIVAEREVLFYAQSGAGKSSLLNARVIPGLEEEGYTVLPVARVGNELPPAVNPGEVTNIFVFSTLLSLAGAEAEPKALAGQTLVEWLREPCQAELPILIFDQFEELFTTHRERWQEAEEFIRQVRQALDEYPNLGVVFAMREDYLASIDNFVLFFARRLRARFRMELLGGAGALAAVKQPAAATGCRFESGVAEKLVDNLRQIKVQAAQAGGQETSVLGPYVEPVQLQVVCSRLWENLPEQADGAIDWADIEQYGDIDSALTSFYESAVNAALAQARQAAPEITLNERMVRRWFGEQLITPMGTRGLVMRGPEETVGLPNAAVEALEAQHIIRADLRAGARWYELSHDRFVDPILKANQEWQLLQGPLMQAAQAWETSGRHKGKLYRGQQLEEALSEREHNTLDPLIQEFLTVSQEENLAAQAEARRKAEEERAKEAEAQAKQQAGAARRRIIMLGIIIILALMNAVVGYMSSTQATVQIQNTDQIRVPVALRASLAQANLLQMQADVRGYLALGDSAYRTSYQKSATAFEYDLAELEKSSSNLNTEDRTRLDELKKLYDQWKLLPQKMFELRDDRMDREPAYRMLATDGVRYAGEVIIDTNSMMAQGRFREPSSENQSLLVDMARFQGNFAATLSALRSYAITGNPIFKGEYDVNLIDNQNTWDRLTAQKTQMTDSQQKLLDNIAKNRQSFLEMPNKIFEIVEGDRSREDLYLFATEAVPLAGQMNQALKAMVDNQQISLTTELSSGRRGLDLANQFTFAGGVIILLLGLTMIGIETLSPSAKARWATLWMRATDRFKRLGQLQQFFISASALVIILFPIVYLIGLIYFVDRAQPGIETPIPTIDNKLHDQGTRNTLVMISPQAPSILNPHLSASTVNLEACRITYEPLASFDKDGVLIPVLAAEIPSLENGGLAEDGKSVTWKLRQNIRWSDSEPFTADDIVFTYQYVSNPDVKASTASTYAAITNIEAIDKYTVKIHFNAANPAWALPFVGSKGMIIPKHIFESYNGSNALEAPANFLPIGTGPYRAMAPGIKPQEVILLGSQVVKTNIIVFEANPYFRYPEKLSFSQVIFRGGSTVDLAAQQVLQQGSADYAYDLEFLDSGRLAQLELGSSGKVVPSFGSAVERILLNRTDPNKASNDGEYSSLKIPHPFFSSKQVRQAFAYAINRDAIAKLYGEMGLPTYANLVSPPQYRSSSVFYEYDLEKAKALLDQAGWLDSDGDGIREKDGAKMKVVLQSQVSTIQQQIYKIIQKDFNTIGIDIELKMVDSSIMFGSGSSNPDAYTRFNADLMSFRFRSLSPDPSTYLESWTCKAIPQKSNSWTGVNDERWCSPEYDGLLEMAKTELNPEKRANMFIQLNDMLIEDVVMIPVVQRGAAIGIGPGIKGPDFTPWDATTWNIQDWTRVQP